MAMISTAWMTLLAQAAGSPTAQTGTSEHVIWAVVLLGMAVALFLAELFVPSGGIIGVLSALCLIGGIVMLFWIDTTVGLIGSIVTLIALPFAFAAALWIWPNTLIGRALMLGESDATETENDTLNGQSSSALRTSQHVQAVAVGVEGKALTELRPVGICLLDGKRYECLSIAGIIDPGTPVKVVAADGMQIKVKPLERGSSQEELSAKPQQ
ncbi:MAG: hypothetical protein D6698_16045 [Gammaproteobacteria bacterium]|nr:MAG: hypothetical protein D6698_16045 [Gammaproteobacteria bacterium]